MQRRLGIPFTALTLLAWACEPAQIGPEGGSIGIGPCAEAPLRTTGTTYYFCDCQSGAASGCVAGNDSDPGTSPSAPRQSFADAQSRFRSMAAGSTVALCRGGAWRATGGLIDNPNCTTSSPCDFRDYAPPWGTTTLNRPRITTPPDYDMFQISSGGGYRLWNLDLNVSTHSGSTSETLVRIYGTAHDVDVCDVRFYFARTAFLVMNDESPVNGVQLRNSQLSMSNFSAIYGGATGLVVDGNYFENNGQGGSNGDHTIYLIGTDGVVSQSMQIVNNEIYNGRNGAICPGVALVVHGLTNNLNIENNYVHTDSSDANCFGIMLSGGNAGGTFTNATIRRNRVSTRGADTIYVDGCIDCVVSDNFTSGGAFSIATGGCTDVPCVQNLKFLNNTIYQGSVAFGTNQSGTGFTIANNLVWNSGGGGLSIEDSRSVAVDANNYVRASGGPADTALFVNPSGGDFRPVGSSLVGAGSSTYYSPTAMGSTTWKMADEGAARTPPIDLGAFLH